MSKEFLVGTPVMGTTKGKGKVYKITSDGKFPLIIRFDALPLVNHYYSLKGEPYAPEHGNITKL